MYKNILKNFYKTEKKMLFCFNKKTSRDTILNTEHDKESKYQRVIYL